MPNPFSDVLLPFMPTPRTMPDRVAPMPSIAGVPFRHPYEREHQFFKHQPDVGGYAAEDDRIVLNPYSTLSQPQRQSLAVNEAARVWMRQKPEWNPHFSLTPQQHTYLNSTRGYATASPQDRAGTIAGRILTGDSTAATITPEQQDFTSRLLRAMRKVW